MRNLREDLSFTAITDALRTVFGRIFLVIGAMALGASLGGCTAGDSIAWGLGAPLMVPGLILGSVLSPSGIFAVPMSFFFTLLFVRRQWPLWTVLIVTLLFWYHAHAEIKAQIQWDRYDSPLAKLNKRLDEHLKESDQQRRKDRLQSQQEKVRESPQRR